MRAKPHLRCLKKSASHECPEPTESTRDSTARNWTCTIKSQASVDEGLRALRKLVITGRSATCLSAPASPPEASATSRAAPSPDDAPALTASAGEAPARISDDSMALAALAAGEDVPGRVSPLLIGATCSPCRPTSSCAAAVSSSGAASATRLSVTTATSRAIDSCCAEAKRTVGRGRSFRAVGPRRGKRSVDATMGQTLFG